MAVHFFLYRFKRIKVYALVGTSGSGKSFRSRILMDKYHIDVLIDDGLIIKDEKILSGKTAKSAKSVLDAVGMAIFQDEHHRNAARMALAQHKFRSALILGTSRKMILRICAALLFPPPKKIINIEDISSEEEIALAREQRDVHGNHVVPVPAFEMQQSFPDVLVSSLRVLFRKGYGFFRKNYSYQKSIVRPAYSDRGGVKMSEGALMQLVAQLVREHEPSIVVRRTKCYPQNSEYDIEVHVSVPKTGVNLTKTLSWLHNHLIAQIQNFSGIIVRKLDIIIDTVYDGRA